VSVREHIGKLAPAVKLACGWMGVEPVYNASVFRLVCHSTGWKAIDVMRNHRRRMSLAMMMPSFQAVVDFTSESIAQLPERARCSACLDLQYFDFYPARDFDEWAIAQQLLGLERIYVPDQLLYRRQVATQVARGIALPSHDFVHRYLIADGRVAPDRSTYHMKVLSDGGLNYLCLHEHWYDEWIAVAWTPDEYLVLKSFPLPHSPTPLVPSAIQLELGRFGRGEWRFCRPQVCVKRPFYGPSGTTKGESTKWTLPNDGLQVQLSTKDMLATERYTHRYTALPPAGSVLKCFVHSDWRLGQMHIKLHGSVLQACPARLSGPCKSGWSRDVLRTPCLVLCGHWGNETCSDCTAAPNPGCGHNDGTAKKAARVVVESFELAHFRIPPPENTRRGFVRSEWLPALGAVIRRELKNETLVGGHLIPGSA